MDIVDRLFELVDRQFKEQKDFAALVGVHPARISEWRKRKNESYKKHLPQIAQVLGTTVDYLVNGEPAAPTDVSESDRRILQVIHDKPGLRTMFDLSAKATEEDILKAVEILKAFYGDAER